MSTRNEAENWNEAGCEADEAATTMQVNASYGKDCASMAEAESGENNSNSADSGDYENFAANDWMPTDGEVSFTVLLEAGPAYVDTVYDDDGSPVRVLAVGGAYQSATYLGDRWFDLPFAYYKSFDRMFDAADQGLAIDRVCMLGGGGCSYPKHLLMTRPQVGIDVVEPDSGVVDLAYEYFFVDKLDDMLDAQGELDRFEIFEEEGRTFLEQTSNSYAVIINDAFAGSAEVQDLVDDEGIEVIKRHLTPGGLYLINATCNESPEDFGRIHDLLDRLRTHFASVFMFDASDDGFASDDNYLILATDGTYTFEGVIGE